MVSLASPSESKPEPPFAHEQWLAMHLADRQLARHTSSPTDKTGVSATTQHANNIKVTVTEHPEYGTFIHVGTPHDAHLVGHLPGEKHEGPNHITRSTAMPRDYARAAISHLRSST